MQTNDLFSFVLKSKAALAGLAAGLLVAGCEQKPATMTPPPAEVSTIAVKQQEVLLTTELPGRTSPFLIAEIRPQVNGLILKRLFTEGADVKKEQELYEIDPAPFQAALDNAQAALGRAEANLPAIQSRFDRYQQALADKAVSQQDFDDAAAARKQALAEIQYYKAAAQTARINLGYAHVVSPISGRIGKSSVTDGAIVTAYQPTPLATIQQLDPIYVDVPQSTTALLQLERRLKEKRVQQDSTDQNKVQLLLEDGTPYGTEGTLQFRDVSVDPTTGSVILRAVFENPNGVLLPGMFVRAVVKEGINPRAILIPQQAVARDPKGNPYALVVAGGKADRRVLELDRALGDQWLVVSGLTPGDHVIAEGMQKVRPGDVVTEVPFGSAKPAPAPAAAAPAAANAEKKN